MGTSMPGSGVVAFLLECLNLKLNSALRMEYPNHLNSSSFPKIGIIFVSHTFHCIAMPTIHIGVNMTCVTNDT